MRAHFWTGVDFEARLRFVSKVPLPFRKLASCCKYAVPEGYPSASAKGFVVDLSQLKTPELAYLGAVDADPATGALVATGSRTVTILYICVCVNV